MEVENERMKQQMMLVDGLRVDAVLRLRDLEQADVWKGVGRDRRLDLG